MSVVPRTSMASVSIGPSIGSSMRVESPRAASPGRASVRAPAAYAQHASIVNSTTAFPQRPVAVAQPTVITQGPANMTVSTAMPSFSPMPSYVPPLQVPTQAPAAPVRVTEGLPDPQAIENQKHKFHKDLGDQHMNAVNICKMQLDHQIEQIRQTAEAQKQHYNLQLDQQTGTQKISLTHQYNKQLMQLREAAHVQKNMLEQQSSSLTLDFHTRKAQQDLKMARYEAQKKHYETQLQNHEAQKAAAERNNLFNKTIVDQRTKMQQQANEQQAQFQHLHVEEQTRQEVQRRMSTIQPSSTVGPAPQLAAPPTTYTAPATSYSLPATSYAVPGTAYASPASAVYGAPSMYTAPPTTVSPYQQFTQ